MRFNRRQMILSLLAVPAARLLPGCQSGQAREPAPDSAFVFEPDRRRALSAAVERILPGAVDAGVPEYIDYWLARQPFSVAPDWKPILNVGAVHLDRLARAEHRRAFCDCKPEQQDALLTRFEKGEVRAKRFNSNVFFQRLVTLTLEGFLSEPKYGGNRDGVGWRFIGRTPCWWAPKRLP
jgi:gluconate 2-dehydrogenase gamma chain